MTDDETPVLDTWSARKLRPVVIVYVLAVFAVFIVVSIFVFHSSEAVKALLLAAVGTVIAIVPTLLERVEYRATVTGIEQRPIKNQTREFEALFRWDELDRVVPNRHGFKFFKEMGDLGGLCRVWKLHFTDEYSGEVHAEAEDLEKVFDLLKHRGVTISG